MDRGRGPNQPKSSRFMWILRGRALAGRLFVLAQGARSAAAQQDPADRRVDSDTRLDTDDAERAEAEVEVEVPGERSMAPPKAPSVAGSVIRQERLTSPGISASDVLRT